MEEVVFAGTTQFIVISLGEEQFGIDIKYIENIVRMQHITRVPTVEDYIKGVINLRGEVIPVLSLRLKMGLAEDVFTKDTRIIIIKLEQFGTLGFIVDQVREVLTLENDSIEKVSYDSNNEDTKKYVHGIGRFGDSLVSLLDLNSVAIETE
ncbi:MAG: chemotaxis protein CheW [Lachnospiraceae bacterium]